MAILAFTAVVRSESCKSYTRTTSLNHQAGMTLVELMVALVLGLILIGGVLNVFTVSRETFRSNENLARMQENARTAFDLMARDLREAGTNSCGITVVANVVRVSSAIPWWADWNLGTVRGVDAGQDVTDIVAFGNTQNARVAGTDAILVIRAAQDEKIISAHDTSTSDITLNSVDGLKPHDIMVACDMNAAAIFEIDTVSTGTKLINHEEDTTNNFNCTSDLGYPTSADCSTHPVHAFQAGGTVAKLLSTFWYVGNNGDGKSSLYRTRIIKKTSAGITRATTEPEEIFAGVKDIQLEYLTRNLSTDTLATEWIPANNPVTPTDPNPIYSSANKGWSSENENQTVAVRITLTLQSDENVGENRVPIERKLIHIVGLRSRDTLFQATP